jgi:iron(III) transport system permease protein
MSAPARRVNRARQWRGALLALPVAMLTLIPLAAIVGHLFMPQPEIWSHLLAHVLGRVTLNTLALMLMVGAGVLVVGVPLAWVTAMCAFPGRRFFAWALMLPLAFPAYVLAFVQMGIFEFAGPVQTALRGLLGDSRWFPDIRGSTWGVVLVLVSAYYPYVYLLARNAFLTQGRRAIEAAQTLGCSRRQTFFRVAVPMARPWIAGGLALVMMETVADFGAVAVFNYDTFTTAIYQSWFDLHNLAAAAQLASLLVVFVLLLAASEQRARRGRQYQVAAGVTPPIALRGRARWMASLACTLVLCIAVLVPVVQLSAWVAGAWREDLDMAFWGYAWNTLVLGLATALLTTVLAVALSWIVRRHSDPRTAWVARLAVLGYAVPGAVLAIGVFIPLAWLDDALIAAARGVGFEGHQLLKGTLATMLLALSARFLAVAFQATDSAMQRITRNQEDAARSLGLGPWGTLRRVFLPLLRPGLLAGFLMVLVDVMKEMPITLMTRHYGWDTLAVRIFQLTSESLWERAALPALAIVLVGLLPVLVLIRQTDRR